MTLVTQRRAGIVLALLGVVALVGELVRYWIWNHEIHSEPVLIGALLGFVGFYILDAQRARDGGQFVVDSALKVIATIRGGRRATDNFTVVTEPKKKDPPALNPDG